MAAVVETFLMLLLSSLSQTSGMKLARYRLSMFCSLLHCFSLLHTFIQPRSFPSARHSECIGSLSPSVHATCPGHFNRLLISFLLKLSHTLLLPRLFGFLNLLWKLVMCYIFVCGRSVKCASNVRFRAVRDTLASYQVGM